MINIFDQQQANSMVARLDKLTPETNRLWGKMDVAQMMAHCSFAFEYALKDDVPRPNFLLRFMVNLFYKSTIIGSKPYKKSIPTAPNFVIKEPKDFDEEKKKLAGYICLLYTSDAADE